MAIDIARAWKDPEYRKSLTPEELASLPPHPAGDPGISDQDLESVSGGGTATKPVCRDRFPITSDDSISCATFPGRRGCDIPKKL
jgi:mersacidin/lichenicidin family type 2 lantibiotic